MSHTSLGCAATRISAPSLNVHKRGQTIPCHGCRARHQPKEHPRHLSHFNSRIQELVQGVLCKMCCSVGHNDGHTLVAIWDQTSWLLLCSTETHTWKNPVSRFSPLPAPTQTKYRVEGFWVFFALFTLSILLTLLCKEEQKLDSRSRISLGITKSIFCILQFGLTNTTS